MDEASFNYFIHMKSKKKIKINKNYNGSWMIFVWVGSCSGENGVNEIWKQRIVGYDHKNMLTERIVKVYKEKDEKTQMRRKKWEKMRQKL